MGKEMNIFSRFFGPSPKKEMESYYLRLGNINNEEMGTMVVFVTIARKMVENNPVSLGFLPGISLLAPYEAHRADVGCIEKMEKLVKQVQNENQNALAAGLMAWNYTLRAVAGPKFKLLAQGIWKELSRGFPFAGVAALAMNVSSIPPGEYPLIPEGFQI